MLMPTFSVTIIGVLAAVVALMWKRSTPGLTVLFALLGAWLGFAGGALVGLAVDIISGGGGFLALIGHTAAAAGAVTGVHRVCTRAPGE